MTNIWQRLFSGSADTAHLRAIRAASRRPSATVFTYQPQPQAIGDYTRGLRLLDNQIVYENDILGNSETSIWDIQAPNAFLRRELQKFAWLDDLAAVNTKAADAKMCENLASWQARYGEGTGLGWDLETVGWRLIRLITHAPDLMSGEGAMKSVDFFKLLTVHTEVLKSLPRRDVSANAVFTALTGWLFAAISLDKYQKDIERAASAIGEACQSYIDENGDTKARCPERAADILVLLAWAKIVLEARNYSLHVGHESTLLKLGRHVRALRFSNHELLVAQGGEPGNVKMIDRALGVIKLPPQGADPRPLGFFRFEHSGLYGFVDAASPNFGPLSQNAHASTAAIFVYDRLYPLVVSKGSALNFSMNERVKCQETAAHSTLEFHDQSSAVLQPPNMDGNGAIRGATVTKAPKILETAYEETPESTLFSCKHDGYIEKYGLTHERKLSIDRDGKYFAGIDILRAEGKAETARLESHLEPRGGNGLPIKIYFHIGPEITPKIDMQGEAVSMCLPDGTVWVFRQNGGTIRLEPAKLYPHDRLKPREITSIIIDSRLVGTSGALSWSFQKFDEDMKKPPLDHIP